MAWSKLKKKLKQRIFKDIQMYSEFHIPTKYNVFDCIGYNSLFEILR